MWQRQQQVGSNMVVVRDYYSLSVRAQRCRTVSSSVHWKLVSYRFLVLVRWQCKIVALFASVKPGMYVASAKETINGGSRKDFIDELL